MAVVIICVLNQNSHFLQVWFKNRRAKWRKQKREQHELSSRGNLTGDSQPAEANEDDEDEIVVTDEDLSPPSSPVLTTSHQLQNTNHHILNLMNSNYSQQQQKQNQQKVTAPCAASAESNNNKIGLSSLNPSSSTQLQGQTQR